ncbi:uncharacterized protein At4g13200, chloroplastic-like [Juglans microcarpa x Juglans regia]|uniref:uncharacterized protein At4g13200, chloroplastic-like n=1 Tax=Juglans microcarpa x Juglans regia TaxID=2249226 RepID=UPI001B7F4AB8|nr:uncharacterized protein At4g13200, chloroplastic-like [Juglans microcarpa x Juglans regia]
MSSGVSASASASQPTFSSSSSIPQTTHHYYASNSLFPRALSSSNLKTRGLRFSVAKESHRIRICCNSSTRPGGSGSGDSDSRSVLDAFFLGKALAEALNERIESTVGEILGAISRLQAEQQKQVQDFQDEVLERAKRAKEKAAREAMEAQGLITSKSTTIDIAPATDSISPVTSPPGLNTPTAESDPGASDEVEPALGVSNDDDVL